MKLIHIPSDRGTRKIDIDHIIRVEAKSNCSKIYFTSGYPLTVAKVLHWFEVNLPVKIFIRIHRSHIVNKTFIQELNCPIQKVVLSNGEVIAMSRKKRKFLKVELNNTKAALTN